MWAIMLTLVFNKKPYIFLLAMSSVPIILIVLSAINDYFFKIMSFVLVTTLLFPIKKETKFLIEDNQLKKYYTFGNVCYIVSALSLWVVYYTKRIG